MGDPVFRIGDEEVDIDWRRLLDLGSMGFGVAVFPLVRETIILLAAWVLILPARIRWSTALAGLGLIVAGLFVVRNAGADPLAPCRWGISLGLIPVLAGLVIVAVFRYRKLNNTDRPVCGSGAVS